MSRSRVYGTEAIVLRRIDFGEADRLLTILSPTFGKLRAIAKGARKTTSRKSGHVELFTRVQLLIARGSSLDIVSQAETIEPHRGLREDLARGTTAHYLAELAEQFAQEASDERPLYELLSGALVALCDATDVALIARHFELRLLGIMGFRPELFRCVRTAEPIELQSTETGRTWGYSPSEGGLLSPAATGFARDALLLNALTILVLRTLQSQPWSQVRTLAITPYLHAQLERVLRHHLNFILERAPQSRRFMREVIEGSTLKLGSHEHAQPGSKTPSNTA